MSNGSHLKLEKTALSLLTGCLVLASTHTIAWADELPTLPDTEVVVAPPTRTAKHRPGPIISLSVVWSR